jgi:hypothetical protein
MIMVPYLWVMFLKKVILHMGMYLMWFLEMVVKLVTGQSMNHSHIIRATPECDLSSLILCYFGIDTHIVIIGRVQSISSGLFFLFTT